MGVSLETWRQRIGLHTGGAFIGLRSSSFHSLSLVTILSATHLFLIIYVLLVIGNVELNPGPQPAQFFKPCNTCRGQFRTAEQHIKHQQFHANVFNYRFECPFPSCPSCFEGFKSLNAHISHHSTRRDEIVGETAIFKCPYCDVEVKHNKEYCQHLKVHLKAGLSVRCPFSFDHCSRTENISSEKVYSVHLSQYHSSWSKDYSASALIMDPEATRQDVENFVQVEDNDPDMFQGGGNGHDTSSESESCNSDSVYGGGAYNDSLIVQYFANFYALLEGKLLVPESSVDVIARSLSFISEMLRDKLISDLSQSLTSVGLQEEAREKVIEAVVSMDPLYNVHHVNAPNICLLTGKRRRNYYKNNFKYQQVIEINLRRNPYDASHYMHYVDVKDTLNIMLEDPTIQKVVNESFLVEASDGTILKDYTDGLVFRNSNTPAKRIDLLLFMDSCGFSDGLKSAKNKYKMHGMYMTLGNLKPYMRSMLKAIRFVSFVNNDSLKTQKMFTKAFERVIQDLKDLEKNGINYKGKIIPVRLQFIQGDNLGQHTLGGFVESFTAHYFCRYCYISKAEFDEDKAKRHPVFRTAAMRTPESFGRDLSTKIATNADNVHGVKRDSPFHQLTNFKVCQPRLPPCIAHDLFIDGVVDNDLTAMINNFIEKGWFSEKDLVMRIKGFKYQGNDSRNKPSSAFSQTKLGGHAIQNWTLLRLLPFLIGHKVDVNDKVWKLYLQLKSVVEYICAPALRNGQVEEMRAKINRYLKKRNRLGNSCKPKYHFFWHIPDLYLSFGPLVHLWTMAFEHRHQYFKRVARICRNFINLGSLLASKFQLLQAYQNMGNLFPSSPFYSHSSPLLHQEYEEKLRDMLLSCNFSPDAVVVPSMTLNEIKYKNDEYLLLGKDNTGIAFVGQIEMLICDNGIGTAILNKYQCALWKDLGLFYVTEDEPQLCSVTLTDLENPCPHPVYKYQEMLCFSLKHAFLEN